MADRGAVHFKLACARLLDLIVREVSELGGGVATPIGVSLLACLKDPKSADRSRSDALQGHRTKFVRPTEYPSGSTEYGWTVPLVRVSSLILL